MDASYKIQRGIHVHLIQFFMCPEFWVHITESTRFFHVSYAVYLTTRQPARTPFAEWWLYPAVAGHYHTCIFNVKHSACVAVDRVWETKREALRSITKYPLKREPLPSEFIAILAAYIKNGDAA